MDLISTFIFWFVLIIVLSIVGSLAWNSYINRLKDKVETENEKNKYHKQIEEENKPAPQTFKSYSPEPSSADTSLDLSYNRVESAPDDYVVFDTETSGLDPTKDALLEIGAIKYINNVEADRFQTYLKTSKEIPPNVSKINGITAETLKDAPPPRVALKNFLAFIGDLPLVAYNADFDMRFLQINYQKRLNTRVENEVIDALPLAREYLYELPNKKLETIKRHFGINVGSHNAIDDCIVTNHLYQFCHAEEKLKYMYGIPFTYGTRELTDIEAAYVIAVVKQCDDIGLDHNKLTLSANTTIVTVNYDYSSLVGIKMYGKKQYLLFYTPYDNFTKQFSTEIEATAASKNEGNTTRVFTTDPAQLSEFKGYFFSRKKRSWSTK